jgi:WhiB family redox-sensing transcriptional regulator
VIAGERAVAAVPGDWADEGACKGKSKVFFPSGECGSNAVSPEVTAAAKAVCRRCPVQEPCLEFALATGERFGVWGGLDVGERRRLSAMSGASS